jgi:AraC family transcriptional regulator
MNIANSYLERINIVFTYIEAHLNENISLENLAKVACFSPFHFHRIFLGMTGETIMSYIKRLKLQRSVFELINTKKSVTQIALDLGYESIEAFIRIFKKNYKISPLQYRKRSIENQKLPQITIEKK